METCLRRDCLGRLELRAPSGLQKLQLELEGGWQFQSQTERPANLSCTETSLCKDAASAGLRTAKFKEGTWRRGAACVGLSNSREVFEGMNV